MTPQGAFIALTKALKRLGNAGDGKALKRYVESWDFITGLETVLVSRRHTVLMLWAKADAACQRRRPVPKPGIAKKANWRDLAFRAKFVNACNRGLDNEDIARLCDITPGAVGMGRHRYVNKAPAEQAMAA